MPSTLTLQSRIDFARTRTRMMQLVGVGGIPNEPALSICNNVLQTLFSSPNNWKFNKAALPQFTTIQNQQDYILSGCTMQIIAPSGAGRANVSLNSILSSNGAGLQETGTTVTALFSDFAPSGIGGVGGVNPIQVGDTAIITGAGQTQLNNTFTLTAVPNATSVQFTAIGGLNTDGGFGLPFLSWLEKATLQDFMSGATVKPVHEIEVVSSLPMESIIQPPFKLCMLAETITTGTVAGVGFGQGGYGFGGFGGTTSSLGIVSTLTMRTWPVPSSQIWNVFAFYQNKATYMTSLSQTWNPWPDDLAYVLDSGVYAKVLDHAEDPRAERALAYWQQDILKALDIRQQEARHESFFPDLPVLRGG